MCNCGLERSHGLHLRIYSTPKSIPYSIDKWMQCLYTCIMYLIIKSVGTLILLSMFFACSLMDDHLTRRSSEYQRCYANVLYCWDLLNQRAEVLKCQSETSTNIDVVSGTNCYMYCVYFETALMGFSTRLTQGS